MTAPLFSAADMAEFRGMSEAMMPHTLAVFRPVEINNGGGDITHDWQAKPGGLSAVPCRLAPAGSRPEEAVASGRLREASALYDVATPVGTNIDVEDRVVVTHDLAGAPNPLTLDVVGVLWASYEAHRMLLCARVF
jgi:hypothetical protein